MNKFFITKESLQILLMRLKKGCDEFIAPKKEQLDDIIFTDTKNDNCELIDYEQNSVISPRAFLLPQTEELFAIKSAKNCKLSPILEKKKRVFYGVRPCDIEAIILMKRFFLDEPVDIYYQQKLEGSFFIALACLRPCSSNSFCHIMDTGPIAKEGFDLQLIPVSGGYLLEAGSERGERIARKNKKLFTMAKASYEKEIKDMLKRFAETGKKINFDKLAKIMQADKVKQEVWEDIGLRCVVCSGCITLCPTCSCFTIIDRLGGDRGVRLRYCDGCPYGGFTKMAGGNAPFPLHKDHIRRFFEHKLNLDVKRYGRSSCVGCSRCIQTCPGNISIKKFIDLAYSI